MIRWVMFQQTTISAVDNRLVWASLNIKFILQIYSKRYHYFYGLWGEHKLASLPIWKEEMLLEVQVLTPYQVWTKKIEKGDR